MSSKKKSKIWVWKDVVVFVKTSTLEIFGCCGRAAQVGRSQKIQVCSCTESSFTPLWYKISDLYSWCPDFLFKTQRPQYSQTKVTEQTEQRILQTFVGGLIQEKSSYFLTNVINAGPLLVLFLVGWIIFLPKIKKQNKKNKLSWSTSVTFLALVLMFLCFLQWDIFYWMYLFECSRFLVWPCFIVFVLGLQDSVKWHFD